MDSELLVRVRHLAKDGVNAEFKMLGKAIVALNDEIEKLREELNEAKAAAAGPPPEKPSWKRPGTSEESEPETEEGETADPEAPVGPPLPPNLGPFGS